MVAGALITCTFTDTALGTLTLNKSVAGRVSSSDQFTVSVKNGATSLASASTSGTGASATAGPVAITPGTSYTLTDTMAAGSVSLLSAYIPTIACTDTTTSTPVTATGSSPSWALTVPNGDNYTCTITNTPAPLDCTNTVYELNLGDSIVAVNLAAGVATSLGTYADPGGSNPAPNELAIAAGGTTGYFIDRAGNIVKYTAATGTYAVLYAGGLPYNTGGAINPQTGIFYFGSPGSGNDLFAYNTLTNTYIGEVGEFGAPASSTPSSTDFTFDTAGNGYTQLGGILYRFAPPTTASTATITQTAVTPANASLPVGDSLAFAGNGYIYSNDLNGVLTQINPASGAVVATVTPTGAVTNQATDAASCAVPNTVSVVKNLPSGRLNSGDQFTPMVSGGGLSVGNSATTTSTGVGTQTPVAGPVFGLPGTVYTIGETAAGTTNLTNYTATTSCIDTANGNAAITLTGGQFTYPAASASGHNIVCTITNTPIATLTLNKVVSGRVNASDQFTVGIAHGATSLGSATTSGTATSVTTGPVAVSTGASYTLTDAMAVGPSSLVLYLSTIACTDTTTSSAVTPSGSSPSWSLTITNSDAYSCTITNAPAPPTVTLTKTTTGSLVGPSTFAFTLTNVTNTTDSIAVAGVSSVMSPTVHTGIAGSGVVVTETPIPTGWAAAPTSISCVDANGSADGNGSGNLASVSGTAATLTGAQMRSGAGIVCAFTDSPAAPTVQLVKTTTNGSGSNSFGFTLAGVSTSSDTVAVNGAGSTASGVVHRGTAGTAATVTESSVPAGWPANPASVACVDANASLDGNAATNLAATSGASATLPASVMVGGAAITCTFTDSALPVLTTGKVLTSINGVAAAAGAVVHAGDVLVYTVTTTNTGAVAGSSVISETTPVGTTHTSGTEGWAGTSPFTQTLGPIAANGGSASATFTVTVASPAAAGQSTVVNAVTSSAGSCAACSVTDPLQAQISVSKTVAGRVNSGDDFTVGAQNSSSTVLTSATTATPGTSATSAVVSIPVGAAYTITDAMKAGSPSVIGQYLQSIICTDTTTGSSVTPSGSGPWTLSVPNADAYTCAVTNTAQTVTATIVKTASTATISSVGQVVTFTFAVENTGNVTEDPVTINEAAFTGSPAVDVSGCAAQIGALVPGATGQCTATYVVTAADVKSGTVSNSATVTAAAGGTQIISQPSTAMWPSLGVLSLEKSAFVRDNNGDGVADSGDDILWSITVTNTGGSTVSAIGVTDPTGGTVTCPHTSLAAGASMTCTVREHVITPAEAGTTITNTATATGTGIDGSEITSNKASARVRVVARHAPLASTGTDSQFSLLIASLLISIGAVLMLAGRARRRRA
jgi:hypothetical protein